MEHDIHNLAKAIVDLATSINNTNNVHDLRIILARVECKQEKLMSAISDFAASVQTGFDAVSADLDAIIAGIANLDALITQLQNSPGQITPADQALLDQIQTNVAGLKAKADSVNVQPPPAPAS